MRPPTETTVAAPSAMLSCRVPRGIALRRTEWTEKALAVWSKSQVSQSTPVTSVFSTPPSVNGIFARGVTLATVTWVLMLLRNGVATKKCRVGLLAAIAGIHRELRIAELELAAEIAIAARYMAEVAGRCRLARIYRDLRFGERAGQLQSLIVAAELCVQRAARAGVAQIGLRVLLAQLVVGAIVVRRQVAAVDDQADASPAMLKPARMSDCVVLSRRPRRDTPTCDLAPAPW